MNAQWENVPTKGRRYLVDIDTAWNAHRLGGTRTVEWLGFIDDLGRVAVRKGSWPQYDIVATLGVPMEDYLDAAKVIIMSIRGNQ